MVSHTISHWGRRRRARVLDAAESRRADSADLRRSLHWYWACQLDRCRCGSPHLDAPLTPTSGPRLRPGVRPWRRRASRPSAGVRHRIGSRSNKQRRDLTSGRRLHILRSFDPRPGPIRSPGGTKHSRDSTRPRRGTAMGVLGCLEEGRHSVGHRGSPAAEAPIQEPADASGLSAPQCAGGGFLDRRGRAA
jgi:hypothetical protein